MRLKSLKKLIRLSNSRGLNILEQAAFVDELKDNHGMSVSEIARYVECSKAWVCVRLGIIKEMSPVLKEAVFAGRFPLRSYMYTLRQFTRVNKIKNADINAFVLAVSGKGLSIREIETLAHGFFRGGPRLKEQIQGGNLHWTLEQMKQKDIMASPRENSFSELEKRTITDLELVQKYMSRVVVNSGIPGSTPLPFSQQRTYWWKGF